MHYAGGSGGKLVKLDCSMLRSFEGRKALDVHDKLRGVSLFVFAGWPCLLVEGEAKAAQDMQFSAHRERTCDK